MSEIWSYSYIYVLKRKSEPISYGTQEINIPIEEAHSVRMAMAFTSLALSGRKLVLFIIGISLLRNISSNASVFGEIFLQANTWYPCDKWHSWGKWSRFIGWKRMRITMLRKIGGWLKNSYYLLEMWKGMKYIIRIV